MHLVLLLSIIIIHCTAGLFIQDQAKRKKAECFWMGFALFLFAALRSKYVGTDLERYGVQFEQDLKFSYKELYNISAAYAQYHDKFFHITAKTIGLLGGNTQFIIAWIGAFVAFSFSYRVYHEETDPLLMFVFFICLRIFSFTLSGLRQALALAFIWIAEVKLKQGKTIVFLLLTVIASLYHATALIFLLAYVLRKFTYCNLFSVLTIGVAVEEFISHYALTKLFNRFILRGRFSGYLADIQNSGFGRISTTTLVFIVLFACFVVYRRRIEAERQDNQGLSRLLFDFAYSEEKLQYEQNMSSVATMFFIMGESFPNIFRLAYYFCFDLFAVVPGVLNKLFGRQGAALVKMVLIVLLILQYLLLGTGAGTEEYSFFWQV